MNRRTFDPHAVQKFTMDDVTEWMELSGFEMADVVNEEHAPEAKLGGVGFTRAPKGASLDFEFKYDEVGIVLKGRCTVRSRGTIVTAKAGELVYLPAGTPGKFHVDEDAELVYVASTPYGEASREGRAALLKDAER